MPPKASSRRGRRATGRDGATRVANGTGKSGVVAESLRSATSRGVCLRDSAAGRSRRAFAATWILATVVLGAPGCAWVEPCRDATPPESLRRGADAAGSPVDAPATGNPASGDAAPESPRATLTGAPAVDDPASGDVDWLDDAVAVEYAGVTASVALRQVARGRPLRIDVRGADPLVGSQPGAATVGDHVRSICAQADWACRPVAGVLVVSDMETKTLAVAGQPGTSTASMRLRALSGGNEAGADGNEQMGVEVEFSPYLNEVADLVRTVLGLAGQRAATDAATSVGSEGVDSRTGVTVLPSANAVLVTARPRMMRAVERQLERFNAAASRTVRLHVAVYEVERRSGDQRGVDLVALRDAAVHFGFRIDAGSTTGGGAVAQVDFLEGNRSHGSRAILRWLETTGTATLSLDEVVEVRNNQVASVDATQTRQFVAKVSQGAAAVAAVFEVGPPEVVFEELRLGWSVALQPTIVEDAVTVRVALSRRSLVEERPYRFGDGAVEGVNFVTDDLNRLMSVSLRSGETKLLTSMANVSARESARGVPWLGWLGRAGTKARREHEVLLMMTAKVL